jgi:hypothetical protein
MAYANGKKLVISREFDAPFDLVWKAITDFERLRQGRPSLVNLRRILVLKFSLFLGLNLSFSASIFVE